MSTDGNKVLLIRVYHSIGFKVKHLNFVGKLEKVGVGLCYLYAKFQCWFRKPTPYNFVYFFIDAIKPNIEKILKKNTQLFRGGESGAFGLLAATKTLLKKKQEIIITILEIYLM